MKTNKLLLLAGMLAAGAVPMAMLAAERSIEASELPPSVRKVVDEAGVGETVKRISVRNAGGRTVYDVEFEREKGGADRLRVAEDGKILGDTRKASANTAATPGAPILEPSAPVAPLGYPGAGGYPVGYPHEPHVVPTQPRLRIEDLPPAAQETIRREALDRPIAVIHEESVDGQKAYVAQFSESGRNPRVYVSEEGKVLRPTEKPRVLLVGTTFSDTPAPVQQALRRELSEGEIVRIEKDKEGRGETETYQVEVKDARGNYHVRVSADGRVLENTRKAGR